MADELTFRILLLACYLPGQIIRMLILRRNPFGKPVRTVNPGREMLMYRTGFYLFLLPLIYGLTPWLDFAHFSLPDGLRYTGFLVVVAGTVVLLLSHSALGSNWNGQLNIRENHTLVVRGIYAYVRHPMYLAFLLSGIGTLLLSANWLVGGLLLIWFWIMYLGRVDREEQMMIDQFGEQYRAYMKSTGRLLPKRLV
ncbi:protein-S-isoprenylcysteine O-methyltransferase [Larkinella soli]|uniref:protein-S-isoprenylcysteine O-methyltransferase n=1 Tax=Larkinella soli TaxID=1770527 RepID=UPI000FFB11F8|nr:protein-S-isoprenylcysteine O-methyltransferase [Larkinella soli]